MSLTSMGLLGSGGGIIEPTRDATQAVSNYFMRIWKISNHWRNPPKVVEKKTLSPGKILIVLSDTGGGHKASASSISSAIECLQPEVEVKTVDVIENYTPWFSHRLYNMFVYFPMVWGTIYKVTKRTHGYPWPIDTVKFYEPSILEGFTRCVQEEQPDLILSVHPILQSSPTACRMTKRGQHIPLITCVTDLSEAHPWWLNQFVDKLIVPTEAVKKQAMDRGVKEAQVAVCGLPLRKGFWEVDPSGCGRDAVRAALGVRAEAPVILLCGGGDGMGKCLVVICGKNEALRHSLDSAAQAEKRAGRRVDIRVLGFVGNMEEWMIAADVLVSKAGPGTIAEACSCGLPILLYDFLPGQEEGNINFVVDGGIGEYEKAVDKVAARCADWLRSPARMAAFRVAAAAAAKPKAALEIARVILEVLEESARKRREAEEPATEPASAEGADAGSPPVAVEAQPERRYEYRSYWWSWLNPRHLLNPSGETAVPAWWREVEALPPGASPAPSDPLTSRAAALAAAASSCLSARGSSRQEPPPPNSEAASAAAAVSPHLDAAAGVGGAGAGMETVGLRARAVAGRGDI